MAPYWQFPAHSYMEIRKHQQFHCPHVVSEDKGVLESHSTATCWAPWSHCPADPPSLDLLCTLTWPSASSTGVRRCCGHRNMRAVGPAKALPWVSFPAPSHLLRTLHFLTGLGSRSGFTPAEASVRETQVGSLEESSVVGAEGPACCSHAGWAGLVHGREGTEAKGWVVAWSRGQARTRWDPEWLLQTTCSVTRAWPRARGDLHRERTVGDFGVAAQCHPGHWKADCDQWLAQHGVHMANTNPRGRITPRVLAS